MKNTLRNSNVLKVYSTGKHIRTNLKVSGKLISMRNLTGAKTGIGFTTREYLPILLALITCTCNGQRLTSDTLTTVKPIDYSSSFGKHARLIEDLTACAILKTDGVDSHLWHQVKPSIWQQYQVTPDLVSYQRQVPMPKRCLPTKLYPSRLIIHFSSNLSKTVWTDPRPNLHIGFQLQSSLESQSNHRKSR